MNSTVRWSLIVGMFSVMFVGCVPVPSFHTQLFDAGEVDLQGKQLYFIPTPGEDGYQRSVMDFAGFGNNPAGDTVVDLSDGSVTLLLDDAHAVAFYGELFTELVVGADGTIGFGEAGDNSSVVSHFSRKEVSLLPIDENGVPDGSVTYDIINNGSDPSSIAITYNGVTAGGASASAQAEFFLGESFGDLALTYPVVSMDADGVYGLSNAQYFRLDVEEDISRFLDDFQRQVPLTTGTMTGTVGVN